MTEKRQLASLKKVPDEHPWGQVLTNCIWGFTFLMVLAFFWQSLRSMLAG